LHLLQEVLYLARTGDHRTRDSSEEVDDVKKTLMTTRIETTPATGLSCYVAAAHSAFTAPTAAAQGTGLSFAGTSAAAQAVVVDVRNTDLPGSPPRGAPV